MLSSLSKAAVAVILGVVLVKENESVSRLYDSVRRKAFRIVREKLSSDNVGTPDDGQHEANA